MTPELKYEVRKGAFNLFRVFRVTCNSIGESIGRSGELHLQAHDTMDKDTAEKSVSALETSYLTRKYAFEDNRV